MSDRWSKVIKGVLIIRDKKSYKSYYNQAINHTV